MWGPNNTLGKAWVFHLYKGGVSSGEFLCLTLWGVSQGRVLNMVLLKLLIFTLTFNKLIIDVDAKTCPKGKTVFYYTVIFFLMLYNVIEYSTFFGNTTSSTCALSMLLWLKVIVYLGTVKSRSKNIYQRTSLWKLPWWIIPAWREWFQTLWTMYKMWWR